MALSVLIRSGPCYMLVMLLSLFVSIPGALGIYVIPTKEPKVHNVTQIGLFRTPGHV